MSTKQTTITPPRIGEYWPEQGGILVALMRGGLNEPDYYLLAASDKVAKLPAPCPYATDKTEVQGTSCFRDGEANTRALLKRKGKHPAAIAAAGYTADGHKDFYLPSRAEARALHVNTPELLQARWIWTSSQYSASYAWYQLPLGDQGWDFKDDVGAVLPVRRLLAIE